MLDRYIDQVRLALNLLPVIAEESVFALKGGSAINLFYRDMPRLSIDIDLTYLPIDDRETSLKSIATAIKRISTAISIRDRNSRVSHIAGGGNIDTRILVIRDKTRVKIETSQITRGTVLPPKIMSASNSVTQMFGFVEMNVLAFEDLYSGKLHAALDRQHPRDLFDIMQLYENEGLTDDLFRVFMVYVASSNRPMHELLAPIPLQLDKLYNEEFKGMTRETVTKETLEEVRTLLFADISNRLTGKFASFLLSLHDAEPNFGLIGLPESAFLPAVRWKLVNLEYLKQANPKKHTAQRNALEALFH